MKRMILIIGLAAFGAGLPAQEVADSLLTGDVQTDSLFQALPEVLVEGERPVVKALPGRLEYDLPRMIAQKPIDNVYDALKEHFGRKGDEHERRAALFLIEVDARQPHRAGGSDVQCSGALSGAGRADKRPPASSHRRPRFGAGRSVRQV